MGSADIATASELEKDYIFQSINPRYFEFQ